jgi:putative pyruvate formate lyase activating enzyme
MESVSTETRSAERLDRPLSGDGISRRIAKIEEVLEALEKRLNPCSLCPRRCGAFRSRGETGECGLTDHLKVAAVARHPGEEPPISGEDGAINVFFSGCNLHCIHCQNWPISQMRVGKTLSPEELAERILRKARRGACTLGWVTPTPQIIPALKAYRFCLMEGCNLPLVYNSGGYEDAGILRRLAGIVDIWLPDVKTSDPERAARIQGVSDYPDRNADALAEMAVQVKRGDARAVIVRHLVLPGGLDDSKNTLKRVWNRFGDDVYLSLMMQYFPFFKTIGHETLGRRLRGSEYDEIVTYAQELGFQKGWVQEYDIETGVPFHCLP